MNVLETNKEQKEVGGLGKGQRTAAMQISTEKVYTDVVERILDQNHGD